MKVVTLENGKNGTLTVIGLLICSPLVVQLQQSCVLWSNETRTRRRQKKKNRTSELPVKKCQKSELKHKEKKGGKPTLLKTFCTCSCGGNN